MNRSNAMIEDFILIRLLLPGKNGLTLKRIQNDIEPFFNHKYSTPDWEQRFQESWSGLKRQDLISVDPSKKTEKAFPTEAGKQKGCRFLGIHTLSAKLTWSSLVNQYLVPKALDTDVSQSDVRKKVASASGLRGAILKQAYNLNIPTAPTENQALDALLWKQLDVETNRPFSLTAVKEHLLNRLLQTPAPIEFKKAKPLLAAQAVHARRSDIAELKKAVIRNSIDKQDPNRLDKDQHDTDQQNTTPSIDRPQNDSIEHFADTVIQAVLQCHSGRFGSNKVFISHVYDRFQEMFSGTKISLESFKSRLITAHQEGCLELCRADLIEAMNPDDVAASEARFLNATFHFIRLPGVLP